MASYLYDGNNNLAQATDRKGQVASYQYDALDRVSQVTYADTSTTTYTYDPGDRVTQVVDSIGGALTRTDHGVGPLLSGNTPGGGSQYYLHAPRPRPATDGAGG